MKTKKKTNAVRKKILKKLKETREWLLEGGDDIGLWLCNVATALAEQKTDQEVLNLLNSLD